MAGREFLLGEIEKIAESLPDTTIIFITQRIEDILPVFSRGMVLANGRIESAGIREDILTEENLSKAFKLPIKLWKNKANRYWAMLE